MAAKVVYDRCEGLCTLVSSDEMTKVNLEVLSADWKRKEFVSATEVLVVMDPVGKGFVGRALADPTVSLLKERDSGTLKGDVSRGGHRHVPGRRTKGRTVGRRRGLTCRTY